MHARRSKKHYSAREREARRRRAESERSARDESKNAILGELRRSRCKHEIPFAAVPDHLQRHDLDLLVAALPRSTVLEDRYRYRRLCEVVRQHRPGLLDTPYREGVESLIWLTWHGEPETWRPRGKGLNAAFRSLVIHLLQSYPLSPHLWDLPLLTTGDDVQPRRRAMHFLSHLAFGARPRLLPRRILPPTMTRRMLHLLTNPPRALTYEHMVRRAQVLGHGGREALVNSLMSTWLSGFQENEIYWYTVIHWFCRQPDLEPRQVSPIVDFLHGRAVRGDALALSGRTPASLRRLEREWREELAAVDVRRLEQFAPSGLPGGVWISPRHENGAPAAGARWEVREILTGVDLVAEGRAMGHCVASYGADIADGTTSIWSLACNGQRRLTFEVRNMKRRIWQVRGRGNRDPKPIEARCVQRWAEKNGIGIRCWVLRRVLGANE